MSQSWLIQAFHKFLQRNPHFLSQHSLKQKNARSATYKRPFPQWERAEESAASAPDLPQLDYVGAIATLTGKHSTRFRAGLVPHCAKHSKRIGMLELLITETAI
jgi:hypothetical protein